MSKEKKLIEAARYGEIEEVKQLLRKHRIDVNSVQAEYGWTPLMKAAKHGHIEVVKYLIEEGKADIHARNKAGVDALIVASKNNCIAVVRYLLSSKANANVSSYDGRTALMTAAEEGNFEVAKLLYPYANVNAKDNDGYSSLMYAAWYNHLSIVKLLVIKGQADIHATCNSKKSVYDLTTHSDIKTFLLNQTMEKDFFEVVGSTKANSDGTVSSQQPQKVTKTFNEKDAAQIKSASKMDQPLTTSRKPTPSAANQDTNKITASSARHHLPATSVASELPPSQQISTLQVCLAKEKKENEDLSNELQETKEELKASLSRVETIEIELQKAKRSEELMAKQITQLQEYWRVANADQDELLFRLEEEQVQSVKLQCQIVEYEKKLELMEEKQSHPASINTRKRKLQSGDGVHSMKKEKILGKFACTKCKRKNSEVCAIPCGHLVMCAVCHDEMKQGSAVDESTCVECQHVCTGFMRIYA